MFSQVFFIIRNNLFSIQKAVSIAFALIIYFQTIATPVPIILTDAQKEYYVVRRCDLQHKNAANKQMTGCGW